MLDTYYKHGSPMKRYLSVGLLLVSSIVQADGSTYQQIVEKTIASNPEVQAAYNNYSAAVQEQNAARGGFYPHINLISEGRAVEGAQSSANYNNFVPDYMTTIVLRQMLFDGFGTLSEVRRLDHAARTRYFELESAMQRVAMETTKAYIDIQKYRKFVGYAQDNFVVHKQLFNLVEERVLAGVGRRVDLEQGSGRLALAEANLLTETNNLLAVTAVFQRLTGDLPQPILPEVDFVNKGVEGTVDNALEKAFKSNPDILASIENIISAEQQVKVKQAQYYPRVDGTARHAIDVAQSGENAYSAADVAEVTLNYNLFNGFTDKSMISQSTFKLNQSHDLRDKACRDTRETLAVAYGDIVNLKSQLSYRDQHQLAIEKAREAYRKQFSIGQRTLLDLLDTENEYFQARRNYTETERDLYTAYARTYTSQGDILRKINVVRSDLPEIVQEEGEEYKVAACNTSIAPELMKINKDELMLKARPLNPDLRGNIQLQPPMPVADQDPSTGRN